MPSYIAPISQFIMDELHENAELVELTDNRYYTGLLREPISLVAPHYTRVGIEYVSESGDGYFFTQLRDWDELKVSIKITVVTSYGNNDQHCRSIVDAISYLFSVNRKKVTDTYKIYVDKIDTSIVETEQARWIGTITMSVAYLTPIPDGIE